MVLMNTTEEHGVVLFAHEDVMQDGDSFGIIVVVCTLSLLEHVTGEFCFVFFSERVHFWVWAFMENVALVLFHV